MNLDAVGRDSKSGLITSNCEKDRDFLRAEVKGVGMKHEYEAQIPGAVNKHLEDVMGKCKEEKNARGNQGLRKGQILVPVG
jgi:hypothetical protein